MTLDHTAYRAFIASKSSSAPTRGFSMRHRWDGLFPHQRAALEFACETGRSASFLDTGLGKSRVEAAFAAEALEAFSRPVLILTPLAVARQMARECAAIGVDARVIREQHEIVEPGVYIANYERLPKLDPSVFGGVVLDESSILKSFAGSMKRALVAAFRDTPARLAATATPAPNDYMEIGQHSEFLGALGSMEMLCRWFINDTSVASQNWRLKGHATADFWAWVASWSRAAGLPSDLGGDDAGFMLPRLSYHVHTVVTDPTAGQFDGLFRIPDGSATSMHAEKRLTMRERVGRAADIANASSEPVIVWCESNDESSALARDIPDSIEVRGDMKPDDKEAALDAFTFGAKRVVVTKPKLAGFGLNWQHAATVIVASVSHSYEQHYQAVRRAWRFGQTRPVDCHVVIADTEAAIWANVQRKAQDHAQLKREMIAAMNAGARASNRRRCYTRPALVTLPKWMEAQHVA